MVKDRRRGDFVKHFVSQQATPLTLRHNDCFGENTNKIITRSTLLMWNLYFVARFLIVGRSSYSI